MGNPIVEDVIQEDTTYDLSVKIDSSVVSIFEDLGMEVPEEETTE